MEPRFAATRLDVRCHRKTRIQFHMASILMVTFQSVSYRKLRSMINEAPLTICRLHRRTRISPLRKRGRSVWCQDRDALLPRAERLGLYFRIFSRRAVHLG